MGVNEVKFFRAGYILDSGYCSGAQFDDGHVLHTSSVVVDYYRITLEEFQAIQIDGNFLLPYSKSTSVQNGYDVEVGAYFSDDISVILFSLPLPQSLSICKSTNIIYT